MTSMDFYPLDKHCPGILSPPVISSTSCVPESGSNDNNGYLNGGPYRSSTDACLPTGHSYCHGGNGRLDNVKMLNNNGASLSRAECHAVGDVDLFASSGFTSYYNLDSHGPLHHQAQTPLEHDLKKAHISFHHMQSSPVYTNVSCSMSVDNQSPMYAKDEFESPLYGLQCTPQSSTSPILPDSPPIVSSNSGNFHPNRHSLSPSHRSMCVAKKSSTNCYELKREMAESSGLNLNGAPYAKARAGRKGTANVASSTGSSGDSSQFTDADSNSGTPSSKQFVPCKVCGDKASGYHYGVTSCEGCKGFFRRSIQKQIEYRCLRDGKCLIIRLNRNRCQYCRFKKCLAVGMSRDSVRYGRVPKKNKEKERMEEKANGVTQAEADQSSVVDVDSKDLALYDTILTISQAHHANCSYTDDKVKGLSKKPIFVITKQVKLEPSDECSSSPDVGSVSESLEAQKIELWEQLALLITPCIQRVVEFAKRIPGFSDLTQDDQLILIKLGFFEVWLVHISKTADFVDNTLTFADGAFLSRKQLELMFDHEFMGNLFHLMSGLNSLTLNDTEIGLFSAIILLQSDRPQIYDIKAINKIQENVVEALKVQIGRNHSDDAQTFQKLMLKINELRALGSSHSLHLQWFRSNWLRLKLPPLFAEIFDIPKGNSFLNSVQPSSAVSQCMQVRDQQTPGTTSNPNNAQSLGQTSVANSSLAASPIENSNI